jgi:glycosyltransferase involved in cell wall biosynthesis
MQCETVLLVHNRYLERGGEDVVYEAEARLLESFGHRVIRYERDNREIADLGQVQLALRTVWSARDGREVGDIVRREGVRVAHFHNTFPLISPAAHHGARRAGAAVVQTLHNFRLLCPGGLFLRDGAPCEKCLTQPVPWPALAHRCYRGSAAATGVLSGMLMVHRALRTWQTQVDAFIVLSRFAQERFLTGGIPGDRMFVSGGALDGVHAIPAADAREAGTHFLYVGRLAPEKGIDVLLAAWARAGTDAELHIIGDGPLRDAVVDAARANPRVRWLGARSREDVMDAMRAAYALVFPSLCYENFPGVLAEAQAAGLPVIASRMGSGAEIVADGGFGLLFDTGDAASLTDAVAALQQDPAQRAELSRRARARYEEMLTPAQCYARLLGIYERALEHRHGGPAATAPNSSTTPGNHE